MKISKSKQELARIISENGGWRDGAESSAQCTGGEISFWHDTATKARGENWCGSYLGRSHDIQPFGYKLQNWHQTILSREEYLNLYQVTDADGWIEWKGGECPVEKGTLVDVIWRGGTERSGVKALHLGGAGHQFWVADGMASDIIAYRLHKPEATPAHQEPKLVPAPEAKPTIEQLAADYRNLLDLAQRKQQEADAANGEADAALELLYHAGLEIGLDIAIASDDEIESELVITDWRDLREGDVIRCVGDAWDDGFEGSEAVVTGIESHDYKYEHRIRACIGEESDWGADFHFIRRP